MIDVSDNRPQGQFGAAFQQCPACRSRTIAEWKRKDFHYSSSDRSLEFHIYRCESCGMGFLNPPPSSALLEEIYRFSGHGLTEPTTLGILLEAETSFPNATVDAHRLASRLAELVSPTAPAMTALDVGSGFGFFTKALRDVGFKTTSINPGEYENLVFRELNGDLPVVCYLEDFETDNRFDAILMSQVLEHIVDPRNAIKKIRTLLKPGGVVACAVPNFRSVLVSILGTRDNSCLWVPEHVNYFTEDGLRTTFENTGFDVLEISNVSRIRYDALARRIPIPILSSALQLVVKFGQTIPLGLADRTGRGIYLNCYAQRWD